MKTNYYKGLLLVFLTLCSFNKVTAQCVLTAYAKNITANCTTGVQTYDVVVEYTNQPASGNLRLRNSLGNITTVSAASIGSTTYTFTGVTFNMTSGEQDVYVDFSTDTSCKKYLHIPLFSCTSYATTSTAGTYVATITNGKKYTTSGSEEYVLNYNGDIKIKHNGDYLAAFKKSFFENVEYYFYSCKPDPTVHPFLSKCSIVQPDGTQGAYNSNIPSVPNPDLKEISLGSTSDIISFYGNVFPENKAWVMPSVYDDYGSYVTIYSNYFANATPFSIQYLNKITATKTDNCGGGSVNFTSLFGGYPEFHASNYTITNNGNGTLSATTVALNGSFSLTGLANGASYNVTVTDVNGGQTVLSGIFCSAAATTSCSTCAVPTCPIAGPYSDLATASNLGNHCSKMQTISTPVQTGNNYVSYYTVQTGSTGDLGVVISSGYGNVDPGTCNGVINRTAVLYTSPNTCATAGISPTSVGGTFYNPVWAGLTPNTTYIVKVTATMPGTFCQLQDQCASYYTPAPSCATCATPTCAATSITATTLTDGRNNITSALATAGNVLQKTVTPGQSVTICVPVTVPAGSTALGFKQYANQSPVACGDPSEEVITYNLKPANCSGSGIAPTRANASSVFSGFNPEWDNITAGNYVLCYTMKVSNIAICNTIEINGLGYYNIIPVCTPPTIGTKTQPTCTTATGSVVISGLPVSDNWTLTATPTIGSAITKSGTGTSTTLTGLAPGTYTIKLITGSCNINATTTVVINAQPIKPTATITGTTAICASNSATLSVVFTGTAPWSITYTDGTTPVTVNNISSSPYTFNVSPAGTKTYYVTAVSDVNCTGTFSGSATVTINTKPTATLSGTTSICNGASATLSVALTGTQPWSLTYTDGTTPITVNNITSSPYTVSVSPNTNKTYTLTAVSDVNCSGTVSGTATISILNKPTATLSGTTSICNGNATNLSVAFTGAQPWTLTYLEGSTTKTVTATSSPLLINVAPTTTTIYTLVSVSDFNCVNSASGSATINVTPKVALVVSCGTASPTSVTFNWNTISDASSYSYTYSINGGMPVNSSVAAGITTLTVNGVVAGQNVTLTVTPIGSSCSIAGNGNCSASNCPSPLVNTINDVIACASTVTSAIALSSPTSGVSFNWFSNNPAIGLALSGSGNSIPSFTTANVTSTQVATISVVASDGPCNGPAQTFQITVNPVKTPTFSVVTTICSGDAYTLPPVSNEGITGTWSPGFDATQTKEYTFTPTNDVCALTAKLNINVNTIPTFTALTAPTPICVGQNAVFTFKGIANATVTYKIDGSADLTLLLDGSGNGSITIPNPTLNVTVSLSKITLGTCSLTLSNAKTVVVNPTPNFTSLTTNSPICSGATANFAIEGTANATVTYTLDGGVTTKTVVLDGSGNATVSITNAIANVTITLNSIGLGSCITALTNTATIVVNTTPTVVSLNATSPICSGQDALFTVVGTANATVNYTVNSGTPIALVLDATGNGTILIVNPATDVVVNLNTITLGSCPFTLSNTKTVVVNPTPTFTSLTVNSPICSGATANFAIEGTANATVSYTLDGGLTIKTIVLDGSGNATVSITNAIANATITLNSIGLGSCITALTNTATVVVNTTPTLVSLNATSPICAGQDAVFTVVGTANATVNYTVNSGTPIALVLDATGNGTILIVNPATDVVVNLNTITLDSCPFTLSNTKTVVVNPTPTFTSLTVNSPICSGATANFAIEGTANATVSYTLDGGVTTKTVVLDGSGNATVSITNASVNATITLNSIGLGSCITALTNTATVVVNTTPTVASLNATSPVCAGQDAVFTVVGTANATVNYTVNSGTPIALVLDATGNGTILIVNPATDVVVNLSTITLGSCPFTLSNSKTVVVKALPTLGTITPKNTSVCSGLNAEFDITGTPNATVTYTLDGGITTKIIVLDGSGKATITIPNVTGSTTVTVSNISSGLCSSTLSSSSTVNVNTKPTASLAGTATLCKGDSGNLTVTLTGTQPWNLTYTDGSTLTTVTGITVSPYTIAITPDTNTTYTLTAVNDANCIGTTSGSAIITVANPSVSISSGCQDSDYVLTAIPTDATGVTYAWYKGANLLTNTSNQIIVNANDTYKVVITSNGCTAEAFAIVTSTYCDIPKGISPNGDNLNDFFELGNLSVKKLEIFNRYGMKVYSKTNYRNEWDGKTDDGQELPDGTYYYVIEFESGKVKTGWVYKTNERK